MGPKTGAVFRDPSITKTLLMVPKTGVKIWSHFVTPFWIRVVAFFEPTGPRKTFTCMLGTGTRSL